MGKCSLLSTISVEHLCFVPTGDDGRSTGAAHLYSFVVLIVSLVASALIFVHIGANFPSVFSKFNLTFSEA